MIVLGCAGFPVPATRYFKEFLFVEVQDTHVSPEAAGTIRRWKREAPKGFRFSLLAPKDIGQEGFRSGKVTETALNTLLDVGKELSSKHAVFASPPEFAGGKNNKAILKEFFQSVSGKFERVIWEPSPAWDIGEAERLAQDSKVVCARDPLVHGMSKAPIAYYRLHGPAGHKSRYEDPAIDKLAELASGAKHKEATYVFTNVDMFADAKRLKKLLKI